VSDDKPLAGTETLAKVIKLPTAFSGPFAVQQNVKWYYVDNDAEGNGRGWSASPEFASPEEIARVELYHKNRGN
jgi:hypothetical protein